MEKIQNWGEFMFTENKNTEDECIALIKQLKFPNKAIDVVLDTDAYNEIDDQFAIAYLLNSTEKLNTKAIYAAPFYNDKSTGPADGMEKSYDEILKLLTFMGREDMNNKTLRGSTAYLQNETIPIVSEAASDLCERAMNYTAENPLYVVAIGAITNIASAILMNPKIIDKIVVIWLGGNALSWIHNREFNSCQDVAAVRVIFNCGVALVQLPCMGVVSAFTVSKADLLYHLNGKNKLCNYLCENTINEAEKNGNLPTWTRSIWDVTAVGYLINETLMQSCLEHCPVPEYDNRYSFDNTRHFYKYVYHINRDALFADLVKKLTK